jgi:hypothetical protein
MPSKIELVKEVTRRLLISLSCLIVLAIVILAAFMLSRKSVSIWGVVMVFGICGGFVSVQRRLKSFGDDDLELLATSWPYVFLSPVTGGALAVILYLLFAGRMLAGDMFPQFVAGETTAKDFSRILECTANKYYDYAKLMFWAFVAGFSESFVTDIIGTFAKPRQGQTPDDEARR